MLKMKDVREIVWFLGIQFIYEDDIIRLNQSRYVEKQITNN